MRGCREVDRAASRCGPPAFRSPVRSVRDRPSGQERRRSANTTDRPTFLRLHKGPSACAMRPVLPKVARGRLCVRRLNWRAVPLRPSHSGFPRSQRRERGSGGRGDQMGPNSVGPHLRSRLFACRAVTPPDLEGLVPGNRSLLGPKGWRLVLVTRFLRPSLRATPPVALGGDGLLTTWMARGWTSECEQRKGKRTATVVAFM